MTAPSQAHVAPGQDDIALRIDGVRKVFGSGPHGVVALDHVDLDIRRNEFFTLLGPSGCGKTTLLRLTAGFEAPTAGRILLDGKDIARLPPHHRPVNTVFQSYALFPHKTVAENVGFGLAMQKRPASEISARVEEMLALVKLSDMAGRRPSQLSGGQQQRVALARALANSPRILLLDEPLSALDLKLRKDMQIELKRIQRETGITFIFVTHDQDEALTMSDRLAVMSNGEVQQVGAPEEIYEQPVNRFVADFIGETSFLPADVADAGDGWVECVLPGDARLRAAGTAAAGSHVVLTIRPERVEIIEGEPPSTNWLAGKVDTVVYHGRWTALYIDVAGVLVHAHRRMETGEAHRFHPGETVLVHLPEAWLRVLPDTGPELAGDSHERAA